MSGTGTGIPIWGGGSGSGTPYVAINFSYLPEVTTGSSADYIALLQGSTGAGTGTVSKITAANFFSNTGPLGPIFGAPLPIGNITPNSGNFTTIAGSVTARGAIKSRTLADKLGDSVSVLDYNAVPDAQKVFLNVSMAVASNTVTVSMPSNWVTSSAVTAGMVCINGSGIFTCVQSGNTAASGGPAVTKNVGARIFDNTAAWLYLGAAPTTANVFAPTDVGKAIAIIRQDVVVGWIPWSYSIYPGIPVPATITQYNSPTSVNVSLACTSAPQGSPTFPDQSWPYVATPSVIVWGTDNSAAFNAALVASSVVHVPAGNYGFTKPIVVNSNNVFKGDGASSILTTISVIGTATYGPSSHGATLIVNSAYNLWMNYYSTTPITTQRNYEYERYLRGDKNIIISDLSIDISACGLTVGGGTCRLLLVTNGQVNNLRITATPFAGYEAVCPIACRDVHVSECYYENPGAAYEPWTALIDCSFTDNTVILPYNWSPTVTYSMQSVGVEVNAVGLVPNDDLVVAGVRISNNSIYANGALNTQGASTALIFFPDGIASAFVDCIVDNNTIYMQDVNNWNPITFTGGALGCSIIHNTVDGYDGVAGPAINVTSHSGPQQGNVTLVTSAANTAGTAILTFTATTGMIDGMLVIAANVPAGTTVLSHTATQVTLSAVTTGGGVASGATVVFSPIVSIASVNGSSTFTVKWYGHGYTGFTLPGIPAFFSTLMLTTIGGVSIHGSYPILSVIDANTFTINGFTNASSTQTVTYDNSFAQIYTTAIGTLVDGNTLKDCSAPGTALITVSSCIASMITNNTAVSAAGTTSGNTAVGNYKALIYVQDLNNQRSTTVANNRGPVGSGSLAGYFGNNRVYWSIYYTTPALLDTNDTTGMITASKITTPAATVGTYLEGTPATVAIANGGTVILSASNGMTKLTVTGATIATGTITLPALYTPIVDGVTTWPIIRVFVSGTITALTVNAQSGTVIGAPTTITNATLTFFCDGTSWMRYS